jgi:hypothetical protein
MLTNKETAHLLLGSSSHGFELAGALLMPSLN